MDSALRRICPRRDTPTDADKGIPQVARPAQTRRDALCPLEDPPRLRAHAAARAFWCTRRVPSRRNRAEPQDLGAPNPRATIRSAAPLVCLISLMIALVASAPRSLPIEWPQNPTARLVSAGSKSPDNITPTGGPAFSTASTHLGSEGRPNGPSREGLLVPPSDARGFPVWSKPVLALSNACLSRYDGPSSAQAR